PRAGERDQRQKKESKPGAAGLIWCSCSASAVPSIAARWPLQQSIGDERQPPGGGRVRTRKYCKPRYRRMRHICGKQSGDSHAAYEHDKLIRLHRGMAWRTEMIKLALRFAMPASAFLVGLNCAAVAQDQLRIAGGLAGTWENSFSELGQNAGFFKKHGLVLEIFYTQGAGETQQAVISGSADIGTGVGTFNTFGAFAKGAPIRVI